MSEDTHDSGIPTRAIHESYLSMQRKHQQYRQIRDDVTATDAEEKRARRKYQDAVLTYFEFLRPHLIHESGLSDYWHGYIPRYGNDWEFNTEGKAVQYVQEHGVGVYQVQVHPRVYEVEQQMLTDGGRNSWKGWHELLGLSWNSERLLAVDEETSTGESRHVAKVLRVAVLRLKELDRWRATTVKKRASGDGFMAGNTHTKTRKQYESAQKITTAKRMLTEATDKLGLLSDVHFSEPTEAGGEYDDALDPDVSVEDLDNR